ncbi:MAG: hypothetical protein ACJ8ER_00725 [Allosphingosinicella sp.]
MLRKNEQLKAGSGVVTNLGTALIAATAARWFGIGFDAVVLIWLVIGLMVIWTGIRALTILEAE